jgi:hypothetical protein
MAINGVLQTPGVKSPDDLGRLIEQAAASAAPASPGASPAATDGAASPSATP